MCVFSHFLMNTPDTRIELASVAENGSCTSNCTNLAHHSGTVLKYTGKVYFVQIPYGRNLSRVGYLPASTTSEILLGGAGTKTTLGSRLARSATLFDV